LDLTLLSAFSNKNPGADGGFLLLYILYERLRDKDFFCWTGMMIVA
jgi:hypothetical protein